MHSALLARIRISLLGRRRKYTRKIVIGGLEHFKVGSGSTVDDDYCIGVLTIHADGLFRRVTS